MEILQPLDIAVNRSFKAVLWHLWERWMTDGEHSFTTTDRMRHAKFDEVGRRSVGCSFSAYRNCKVSKSWPLVSKSLTAVTRKLAMMSLRPCLLSGQTVRHRIGGRGL